MRKGAQISVRIAEQEMTKLRELAQKESLIFSELIRIILATNAKEGVIATLNKSRRSGI